MKIEKRIGAALTASALALGLFASPLEGVPLSLGTTVSAQEQIVSEYISVDTSSLPDSRELEEAYINKLFYGGGFSFYKDYGRDQLSGTQLEIYNTLRSKIESVANGDDNNTTIDLTRTATLSLTGSETEDEIKAKMGAELSKFTGDVSAVFDYLLVDLPEDFYWFDKTNGNGMKQDANSSLTGTAMTMTNTVTFTVSQDYMGGNNTTVDSSKISAAKTAVAYAQTIAAKYNGKTDYEKIVGYCKEICALTAYNDAAANDATKPPYGNPWQLVWVFDNDDTTNVVCEGYSKAFQYLCDLGGIECYTVTGEMSGGTGAGGHMWNIVVLGGVSYLVDITNCDEGTAGNPDKLLLKGASTSTASGCKFEDIGLTYTYDDDIIFPASILTVSTKDYDPDESSELTGEISIEVSPKNRTIAVGETFEVTVSVTATEGFVDVEGDLTYEYDETVISAKYTGEDEDDNSVFTIEGLAEGSTDLTIGWKPKEGSGVTLEDPIADVCKITVTAAECEHEWSEKWEKDDDGHWQVCEICGDESEKEDHNMVEVPDTDKEPTCTEEGKKADMVCSDCGHEKTGEAIEKTEHTPGEPVREDEVAATCTEEGSYNEVIKCKDCGYIISTEKKTIDKIPHTPGTPAKENEIEATCTKDGSYDMVTRCTVCEEAIDTEHTVVPALGHDFGSLVQGETTHYQECSNCGTKVGEAAHTKDSGTVTTAPTKDTDGVRTYSCTVCGKVLDTEIISALGEDHEHSYTIKNSDASSHWNECVCGEKDDGSVEAHSTDTKEEIALEAVCNVDGLKYVITYCTDCDREISRVPTVIPKTGAHNAGADYENDSDYHWNICTVCGTVMNKAPHEAGPAATETTPQTCTVCGYEIAPVLAHNHTYSTAWTHDDSFHWHAATCQHTDEVKDKAVHVWNGGVVTTEPTETSAGVKTFTCTVCAATKTEPVSALTHTHTPSDAWRFDITGHWHVCGSCDEKLNFAAHNEVSEVTAAPTATVPGTRRYYCSICRYVIRQEVIPATGTDIRPATPVTAPVIPTWINSNTASAEPTLDNGSGKSGWKNIANDIKKASNGDTVYVDMNGAAKLSKTALKELIGKNVDLVLKMNESITWTINGETVTKTSDVNMEAKLNTNNIPNKITEKLSESGKVVQVSLSHSGSFGFDAVMTVYLGTMYNGKYANLMYYNPASGAAEFIDCSLITNGNASLDFTHASEYAIVISDEPMGAYEDVSAAAGAFENDINVSPAVYVSIIAAIAAAMMIFRKRTSK
ncbi:MAG: hypothetical protein HDT24_06985 [Ruminococcus sp.]|nr:hypothetical protein [Ruminococcus sp.]